MNYTGAGLHPEQEVLLVSISLNPSLTGEEIREQLESRGKSFTRERFSSHVDSLVEKGLIGLEHEADKYNWRLTELGRLALKKLRAAYRFEVVYARENKADSEVIKKLSKEKDLFERACTAADIRRRRRSTDST